MAFESGQAQWALGDDRLQKASGTDPFRSDALQHDVFDPALQDRDPHAAILDVLRHQDGAAERETALMISLRDIFDDARQVALGNLPLQEGCETCGQLLARECGGTFNVHRFEHKQGLRAGSLPT